MGSKSSTLRSRVSKGVRGQQCGQNLTRSFGIRTRGPGDARVCVRLVGQAPAGSRELLVPGARSCSNTAPHHTCSPVHANLLSYPTPHISLPNTTYSWLSILALLLTHVRQLTSFRDADPLFWGGGGYGFRGWVNAAMLLIIMWVQ